MSDAITLDVLSSSPVQLDVGDADPIARKEIAKLAERVTTVEGDVTALDARVEAIEADYVTSEDVMGALGGEAPTLVSGSSRAMLGDPETASWMERTTAADGAALIESICGNTIVQDGSLLPVRMEGVETTGKNLFYVPDVITSASSYFNSNGVVASRELSTVGPLAPGAYTLSLDSSITCGDVFVITIANQDESYRYQNSQRYLTQGHNVINIVLEQECTQFVCYVGVAASLSNFQLEAGSTATAYEPYWRSERTIPASTYFPQGMRSAGTVYDELRADAAVTRVGAVDLGTLTWGYNPNLQFFEGTGLSQACEDVSSQWEMPNIICDKYETQPRFYVINLESGIDKSITTTGTYMIRVRDSAYTNPDAFKAAMSGVMLYYALATPTTTPIDPPLPLSYRTGAGGMERVMVASGTQSAPPVFATRYPVNLTDLAASIAPVDGPIAKTNHQVGDLIMLGFTLCKATQVIVTGETIEIGTNVTKTTVAAELAALSQ